jgi:energy-coupling factor transporter ATP-binding protein EcfA2
MIQLHDISFRYRSDSPLVLDRLSLRIGSGESICLMGGNGCGKSTLARLLAGLAKPSEGEIRIDERLIESAAGPLVGILFQNPDNQMVATTVEKEIAFGLENMAVPMAEMEKIVDGTLLRFGISHLRQRLTSELSGGEKQRVALASVMVTRPRVLILDEPDSFLDAGGKQILGEELKRLHADDPSLTELRVTQYPYVARDYERLVLIHEGRVAADGDPAEILADLELCRRTGLRYESQSSPQGAVPPAVAERARHKNVTAVRIHNLSAGYPGRSPVVVGLSQTLAPGETVGLIGPSGAGKSTLGLVLCGVMRPILGRVDLLDGAGKPLKEKERPGVVVGSFQQPERQFFLNSCAEEIAFGPANVGQALSERELADLFGMVGLKVEAFGGRDPFSLSMGEKRRLAFAAILAMKPSYIVFDEPTCGLDPEGVGRFIELSRRLARDGVGQVVISHDGDVIKQLCGRVISLSGDGRFREWTAGELFSEERYAGLISAPTC